MALVMAIVIEIAGLNTWWDAHDGSRLKQRTETELSILEAHFGSDSMLLLGQLHQIYWHWMNSSIDFLSARQVRLNGRPQHSGDGLPKLSTSVQRVRKHLDHYVRISLELLRETSFRLAAMTVGWIVILFFGAVGLVDGLVRRDIRRWSGGRESSWIYNTCRRLLGPVAMSYTVVFLIWPWPLNISWTIAIFSVVVSILLSMACSRFKKYL